MNLASEDLLIHYQLLENDFTLFFEDLRKFCNLKINQTI